MRKFNVNLTAYNLTVYLPIYFEFLKARSQLAKLWALDFNEANVELWNYFEKVKITILLIQLKEKQFDEKCSWNCFV
jgi:hypothetical protein